LKITTTAYILFFVLGLSFAGAQEVQLPEQPAVEYNDDNVSAETDNKQDESTQAPGRYQITDVEYNITGITRKYAVALDIKIDKRRIFESEAELMGYVADLRQQFLNQRNFASSSVDFTVTAPESDGIGKVTLYVSTTDTHHFLGVPYPKYNSNSGLNMKIKLKDTNFLGSLHTMSSDVSFAIEDKDDDDNSSGKDYKLGLSMAFDIPFGAGPFEIDWINSWSISYTIGKSSPEWNASTGLEFSLPFDTYSLVWLFQQESIHNFDYKKYDDDVYFTELAKFSIPIKLQYIDNWGYVTYTPYVSTKYTWDRNGISSNNPDLKTGPVNTVGHTLSTGRVDWTDNWKRNFRNGMSFSFGQSMGYNTDTDQIMPHIDGEAKIFIAFKNLGMNMDAYAFANQHDTENIGSRLRGIRDDQKFDSDYGLGDTKALSTEMAIVINMDMPIHIFTFDFDNTKYLKFLHIFNCEVQFSPFMDIAFTKNKATGNTFWYKDGWYAGGLEVLVFPQKWRSLVVRGSVGVDLGRYLLKSKIDTDWRRNVSKYEIEIGVGLHY
jgi:hypothetical protein